MRRHGSGPPAFQAAVDEGEHVVRYRPQPGAGVEDGNGEGAVAVDDEQAGFGE